VLKPGRTLTVCFGEVHAKNDGKEKLVATMLATMTARENTGLVD
jgi:acyl-coenzyme A thioesterase PaaI-like protein